jgi:hypothetical protein
MEIADRNLRQPVGNRNSADRGNYQQGAVQEIDRMISKQPQVCDCLHLPFSGLVALGNHS